MCVCLLISLALPERQSQQVFKVLIELFNFFFFTFIWKFYILHIDVSPQGWDLTARCKVSRGRCPELHTSEPAQSSARCDPGKWPPTGAAAGGGRTAAPDSWLLGCPADRPPGVGKERWGEGRKSVKCVLLSAPRNWRDWESSMDHDGLQVCRHAKYTAKLSFDKSIPFFLWFFHFTYNS